jgi:hypothetical protein
MILHQVKNRRFVFYLALFFSCNFLFAQQTYFQQRVDYKIDASLNDEDNTVMASEEIKYVNNSPQSLDFIYFHLWPNAYKNNSTALARQLLWEGKNEFFFSKPEERGFIDSLHFKVNGKIIKWEFDKEHIDICKLILNEPLKSSDSLIITTPFYLKIPDAKFSRLGHTFQAYYMTQWYPKPAVFDNTGWHQMPYLDQGEFYSEYGSFDVKITLPDNYLLCATGDRVDAIEEEEFLNRRAGETLQHAKINSSPGDELSFPVSSKLLKTVRFKQSRVHDFAWFADKRFYVMHDQVELPASKRKVDTWVFFTPKNFELWKNAIGYVNQSTLFYSRLNGDYPYNHVTAVDGSIMAGGGMEYPNITVIGDASSALELDMVITHEVGHNWFYGILGSNERDYPFMDEGVNSFYELRYLREKYPRKKIAEFVDKDSTFKLFGVDKIPLWKYHEFSFYPVARANKDQAIALNATDFTETNYGAIVYGKSALVFDYLMDYLGENVFDSAMHLYFENFKFRHPNPNDLFKTLEAYSGKDLRDFQKHMIFSNDRIDYKISSLKINRDGSFTLKLKNKTRVNLPLNIYAYDKNNTPIAVKSLDGFEKTRTITLPAPGADHFKIDGLDKMPDINRRNNSIKAHGLFKHSKPLQLKFVTSVEDPAKTIINYVPVAAGNFYNGAMVGIAFQNYGFYQKRFEYLVAPMYAFNTKTPVGFAECNVNFYPKKLFTQITLGAKGKTFSYDYYDTKFMNENLGTNFKNLYLNYYKIAPYIKFEIKKKTPTSNITQFVIYSNTNLFADSIDTRLYPTFATGGPRKKNVYSFVNQLSYDLNNKRSIDPFDFHVNLQHTASMAKISATLNYKITVGKKQSIDVRLFAGTFIAGSDAERGYYAFRASGYNGWQDYLFESNYAARNERGGFGFTQFTEKDGALKVWTPLGQTSQWMTSMNVKSPKIFKIPVKVFADVVLCDGRSLNNDQFLWDAGLNLVLWDNIVEVYIPLLYNKDIKQTLDLNNIDFYHSIRFTFNIHKLVAKNILQNFFF